MQEAQAFPRLVDGEWRAASSDAATIAVHDPAEVATIVGTVPSMTAAEVSELYAAAEAGARRWRATSLLTRGEIMATAADNLRADASRIAADLVAENGKTAAEAAGEVGKAADFLDYYAGMARLPYGTLLADARPKTTVEARREPLGVVCLVTPWNDPLLTPARKLAPALLAGNAIILKPASETPIVSVHLARALDDAGLPAGVLGLAIGRIGEIEEALFDDERLAAVSFTGSTAVGRTLQRRLAGRNVRVQTEMGGKNASVVLADADLDLAAATIAAASFAQAGQRCTATSRVVAEAPIAEELTAKLVAAAKAARLGPGADPATTMGPLVSRRHQSEVLGHVGRAREQGATIAAGGDAPDGPLAGGCFVAPTVVTEITTEMDIWREEVFGPVVAITVVDDFEEAVAAANDSAYGLSAAVFTSSLESAHAFADRAEAGQVSVNLPTSGWDVHHPFGGFGDSGSPFKEQGTEALNFYTRVKTVAIRTGA
ncbi:MAG: aldehyde dehydrogenase family protein [Nocardioides sp.]|uniref:aldehyde dehydrogenase family protein n=1 Tax=Nocardioides sp. TaxID=35761 RepID=UPI0039E23123